MKSKAAKQFGKRLKALRTHYGWIQAYAAERSEITNTYYSELECGKRNVSLENINALAKGFKVTLSQLFDDNYYPKISKKTNLRK